MATNRKPGTKGAHQQQCSNIWLFSKIVEDVHQLCPAHTETHKERLHDDVQFTMKFIISCYCYLLQETHELIEKTPFLPRFIQ